MGSWADVLALPPLPTPDYCAMRSEACCGNTLVCFLIFLFVAPMQAYVQNSEAVITPMVRVWMFAIYAEAATAIFCLIGLMWGDPGTVKRTPENCYPMPDIVAERLRNGQTLSGVGNVHEDGRVFCIRCLVWRPDDSDVHHCGTCQRCVTHFGAPRAPARAAHPVPAHTHTHTHTHAHKHMHTHTNTCTPTHTHPHTPTHPHRERETKGLAFAPLAATRSRTRTAMP